MIPATRASSAMRRSGRPGIVVTQQFTVKHDEPKGRKGDPNGKTTPGLEEYVRFD